MENPASSGPPVEEWPLTALLRGARAVFATVIRRALAESGFEDLPPNGPYVISAIAGTSAPLGDVIRQLGVSKQAAGQLVDTLVDRGYIERASHPDDRRRMVVRLTERGATAGRVIRARSAEVEDDMAAAAGPARWQTTRQVLAEIVGREWSDA